MGAEAVRNCCAESTSTCVELRQKLREELEVETQRRSRRSKDLINRLKIVEAIRDSDNQPEWMVLDVIPVIPPDLRPLVLLDCGHFATSDLNDLYRRIINRNNRLKKLVDLNAPEVIIRNEKRMLQQSVDALFDNNRCKRPVLGGASNRPLKSLTDMIKGKQGRFRENLLGKRVDYSARSRDRRRSRAAAAPVRPAEEDRRWSSSSRSSSASSRSWATPTRSRAPRRCSSGQDEEVWDILEEVIHNHPVLLNRAPTLHRMGIQAFEPVLVEGNAIQLHPLVCKGFNADFDGDQMAVHLPLSIEAQVEAHVADDVDQQHLQPGQRRADHQAVAGHRDGLLLPHQARRTAPRARGGSSPACEEVLLAYQAGEVETLTPIRLRYTGRLIDLTSAGRDDQEELHVDVQDATKKVIDTTVGRVIFNDILPDGDAVLQRPAEEEGAAAADRSDCYQRSSAAETIDLLDDMKELGFREATQSGLSFATDDLIAPSDEGTRWSKEAERRSSRSNSSYQHGAITEGERYNQVLDAWTHAREQITGRDDGARWRTTTAEASAMFNPIFLMADSGARGSKQIRQLAGMRGLMAKPSGKIIETPIKANFREGLTVLEYFSSTHGARKGLADTALKTADSGYLTRKLADVAQNVVITENDCGTTRASGQGRSTRAAARWSSRCATGSAAACRRADRQPDHRRGASSRRTR